MTPNTAASAPSFTASHIHTDGRAQAEITGNAMEILQARYLDGESVDAMFHRVADGVQEYVDLMSGLYFLPNSPTLFNAGRDNGCTLSACFVFNIQDSMFGPGSIFDVREKSARVAKAGGGVGYYGGDIRRKGAIIKSIHRKACGPVSVLYDLHGLSKLITQGGKRDLAQMFVLNSGHEDIEEFIHCKDEDPQGLGSFNISVGWAQDHFEQTKTPGKYQDIWFQQIKSAWSHGCPGVFFPDTTNDRNLNPHLGLLLATNPCGETPNRDNEPCNLGSLNVWRYVNLRTREFDYGLWEDHIRVAIRFLDDILDRNIFPHPDITEAARLTRKLGLGIMGWADMLALQGIHYDTIEAVNLVERVWGLVKDVAHDESAKLAKIKGPYPGYSASLSRGEQTRNETCTSIAPTGTISILANASSGLEPHWALQWERVTKEGMKLVEQAACLPYLDGFTPKVAADISWEWHVRHQAAFQWYTDLGVSKTVNLPNEATVQDVSDAYHMMHTLGCKGGTVFRDGCRNEQVLRKIDKTKSVFLLSEGSHTATPSHENEGIDVVAVSVDDDRSQTKEVHTTPQRRRLGMDVTSRRHKVKVAGTKCYLNIGFYHDGQVAEVFIKTSKMGSTLNCLLDSWAIAFSQGLQYGIPLEALCKQHLGNRFEPNGLTNNPEIPVCSSLTDYVCRLLLNSYVQRQPTPSTTEAVVEAQQVTGNSGMYCPECEAELIFESGCLSCSGRCGWSKCG